MKTRITKFITRLNCPETNSSSSHSFVFSRESLKESDLLKSTQTLIPEIQPDGKKVIILNGKKDEYEIDKRVNDSKSKVLYALASCKCIYTNSTSRKKKINEIIDIIKETLEVDDVIIKNLSHISIDHQSWYTLQPILKSDREGIKEFIFNPRVWLFLLYDSEDCIDNPIFDVCKDYFNYEISITFPIIVKKYLEDPEIQNIEFTKLQVQYPTASELYTAFHDISAEKGIDSFNETEQAMGIKSCEHSRWSANWYGSSNKTANSPEIFEFFGILGKEDDFYVMFLRSTLWKHVLDNLKRINENPVDNSDIFSKPTTKYNSNFQLELERAEAWAKGENEADNCKYIVDNLLGKYNIFTEEILSLLNIKDSDLKLFKLEIYNRKEK